MLGDHVVEFPTCERQKWKRDEIASKLAQAREALAGGSSEVEVSERLNIPRSTLRYWLSRKDHLDGSKNVAEFFESPDGLALLHRIVMAMHFSVMYSSHGIRGVCTALERSGLSRFVASSYGAQQQVAEQVEEQMVAFGERQRAMQAQARAKGPERRISLVEDETFHPEPCLVGIEPESDFIVLETYAAQRNAETWNAEVEKALAGLNMRVVQSTSDEAKGILAHVRAGLGAHHSPDLFHLQQDLARGVFSGLGRAIQQARDDREVAAKLTVFWEGRLAESRAPGGSPKGRRSLEEARQRAVEAARVVEKLEAQHAHAKESLKAISTAYHPYDLTSGAARGVESLGQEIGGGMDRLRGIAADLELGERALKSIDKARRLLPSLLATLTFVFTFILARVNELDLSEEVKRTLHQQLIPAFYLQGAATKAPRAEQRKAIEAVATRLLEPLRSADSPLRSLDSETFENVERVARECANIFQRSSSCVEGRNGQLALHHHSLHKIRPRKLRALTVVHNYYRPSGPTPAERLFRTQHEDLFTWLADHVDLPARPARKRPRPSIQPLLAAAA
jgi:hypothetical protein